MLVVLNALHKSLSSVAKPGNYMQHEPVRHHVRRAKIEKGMSLATTFWSRVIDVAIYPIGGLSLVLTIPQVYEVWVVKNVEGISLITWSMWTVSSLFWLMYGVVHKARAVAIMQIGWISLYILVIVGVLVHS